MDRVPSSLGVMPIVRLATSFGSPNHVLCVLGRCVLRAARVLLYRHNRLLHEEGKGKAAAEYIELERKNADFDTEFSSE